MIQQGHWLLSLCFVVFQLDLRSRTNNENELGERHGKVGVQAEGLDGTG